MPNQLVEKTISLNIRKNSNLLSQLKIRVIPKQIAMIHITQGEGEGESYKILAREKTFAKLMFLLGGVGMYSVVINRRIGRRMRKGYKKQRGLRRFGRWLIEDGQFRRIKSEELDENIMILDDKIVTLPSESLFNQYFKSTLPVGDFHGFN